MIFQGGPSTPAPLRNTGVVTQLRLSPRSLASLNENSSLARPYLPSYKRRLPARVHALKASLGSRPVLVDGDVQRPVVGEGRSVVVGWSKRRRQRWGRLPFPHLITHLLLLFLISFHSYFLLSPLTTFLLLFFLLYLRPFLPSPVDGVKGR